MTRPAVLIVEPAPERRHELSRGLAQLGYEVVPAIDVAEGLRFAEGLGPSVIIASAEQPELLEPGLVERFAGSRGLQTLVLLGRPPVEEAELPQEVLLLPAEGQATAALVRRLRLVLLGREIGVEPDTRLESLVGDLSLTPPLELVRSLARAEFTGRVVVDDGEISFERGRVVGATAGRVRGVKAFCRLGRRLDGVFRVWPEPVVAAGGIEVPVNRYLLQRDDERLLADPVLSETIGEDENAFRQLCNENHDKGMQCNSGGTGPAQSAVTIKTAIAALKGGSRLEKVPSTTGGRGADGKLDGEGEGDGAPPKDGSPSENAQAAKSTPATSTPSALTARPHQRAGRSAPPRECGRRARGACAGSGKAARAHRAGAA